MQRKLLLTLTALIVTTALLGAAFPVSADRAESNDDEGLLGDLDLGSDTDAEDGEANAHGSTEEDDDSLIADLALDGDDETAGVNVRSVDDDGSHGIDFALDGD